MNKLSSAYRKPWPYGGKISRLRNPYRSYFCIAPISMKL